MELGQLSKHLLRSTVVTSLIFTGVSALAKKPKKVKLITHDQLYGNSQPVSKSKKSIINRKNTFYPLKKLTSQYTSWGIHPNVKKSNIHLGEAWRVFKKKKDIVVAVVDTGIDYKHPFLKKNIHSLSGKVNSANYGMDFSIGKKAKPAPFDKHGHGTHVAGIVKSVFPEVKILALKYYNPEATNNDNLKASIKALKYAVDMNVDIINYSGGGPEPSAQELSILKKANQKGILVIAAAGNEESNIDQRNKAYYPASYGLKNIITVTAHDQDLNILSTSNWGRKTVDISAPGLRITSALPHGRSGRMTGTSQATAFATGVAALIKSQHPKLSSKQIKAIIIRSAGKNSKLIDKCSSGGYLNAGRALKLAGRVANRNKSKRKLANSDSDVKFVEAYAK
ncbi:MAG: S8 family serine peptidase [Bacteriovoracaceae bacterium]|jgi:subtilisin family serine protease|nr:S8 family serine peptidase [Bacteriovoracaceae bacterium]